MNRLLQYGEPYYQAQPRQCPLRLCPDDPKPRRKVWLIAAVFIVGALFGRGCGQIAHAAPAIPGYAAELAATDLAQRTRPDAIYYLWSKDASDSDYNAASAALNFAVSQSSFDYVPPRLAGGALILVDLTQLVDSDEQLHFLQRQFEDLASREPYFGIVIDQVVHGDKTHKEHVERARIAAPYLGPAGSLVGFKMFRVDQFVAAVLSSVDGGFYLRLRGLTPGKTKRGEYLASRGYSLEDSESSNSVDFVVMLSQLTGRPRAIELLRGRHGKPSNGGSLGTMTIDPPDGPLKQTGNPFMSLLGFQKDKDTKFFNEIIVTLPNGYHEYTLWDDKGVLIAEAAPNVATDSTVPPHSKARLQCGGSCINCHGSNSGHQDIENQRRIVLQPDGRLTNAEGTLVLNADVAKLSGHDLDSARTILSRFGAASADINAAIGESREALNRRFDVVSKFKTEHSAKEAMAAAGNLFNSYPHAWVTPEMACAELGFEAGKSAKATLKAALPPPDIAGRVSEGSASVLGQLEAGYPVQRNDFEQAFAELEQKAVVTIETAAKKAAARWNPRGVNLVL